MSGLSIALPVDFAEAIEWSKRRGTGLPQAYHGTRAGLARARAFTVSDMASLDQIAQVRASLQKALEQGSSFGEWKKLMELKGTAPGFLALPPARKELVFRNFVQGAYAGGRWQQQRDNARRPYLMYDAVNDARTRPAHRAMDGIIRPVGDPFWKTHFPPCGHNCRCTAIGLTEAQAKARGGWEEPIPPDAKPDPGWDYNPGEAWDGKLDGLLAEKLADTPPPERLRPWADRVGPEVEKRLGEWAAHHDMTPEQLAAHIDAMVRMDLAHASVWTRMPVDQLAPRLLDPLAVIPGTMANTDPAAVEAVARTLVDFERGVLGIQATEPVRPLHGYVTADPQGGAGDGVAVKLRPSVQPRAWVAGGDPSAILDTARNAIVPEPLLTAGYRAMGLNREADPLAWAGVDSAGQDWRAFVAGAVELHDVEKLVFAAEPSPGLAQRLKGAGIAWEVVAND